MVCVISGNMTRLTLGSALRDNFWGYQTPYVEPQTETKFAKYSCASP